jgi:2-hydroxycyclohexanecarboxyl-CoA dehydrogenase
MSDYPAPVAAAPDYAQLLKDRVAIVTGGGAGIGGSISRVFARAGARVVIAEINADYAAAAQRDIEAAGGKCRVLVGDIRERSFVDKMVAEALSAFGRIDVLVNNVGHFQPYKLFAQFEEEDFDTQYQISFLHVLRCTRAVLPHMISQGRGSIIHVSSVEGQRGIPGNAVYSAYKAALINFARSLAVEVGGHGVRVNCLAPDLTHTPQTPMYDWLPDQQQVRCWAPLGRFAHPDEQADVALFLASDQSRFVTGQTITADGGTMAAQGWYKLNPDQDRWSNTPALRQDQPGIDV